MHGNPQTVAAFRVLELRREGGRWLREQRERANLSQRQLAAKSRRKLRPDAIPHFH
jgi:hypothetical protein